MNTETQLIQAVKKNDMTMVLNLIRIGVDVNQKNSYGTTPLYWAYKSMNIEMIRVLTDAGAELSF